MLLFNTVHLLREAVFSCDLNTSNVIIQLSPLSSSFNISPNLNTSNVIIQRYFASSAAATCRHLNTSNVIIQLSTAVSPVHHVSSFKYIQCYYSTVVVNDRAYSLPNLNTSNVIIQRIKASDTTYQ